MTMLSTPFQVLGFYMSLFVIMLSVGIAEDKDGFKVDFTVAALPSVVPQEQDSYAAGVSGVGFIDINSGEWKSIGLIPRLGRSKKVSWNTADTLILYQKTQMPVTIVDENSKDVIEADANVELTSKQAGEGRSAQQHNQMTGKLAPVASVRFPQSEGPFLLLLGPGQTDGEKYRLYVLPDDRTSFPEGSIKLLNTSLVTLACEVGEEQFVLPSGAERVVLTHLTEATAVPVRFASFDEERNSWRHTWGTSFGMNPAERRLLLIPPGTDGRSHSRPLSIRGF